MGKQKRIRRALGQRRIKRQQLKSLDGMDPELVASLRQILGKDPTVADAQELQLAMTSHVLKRMVEIRLAQWVEAALIVLRDEFGFDEKQLATFAKELMERISEQAAEAAPADNGALGSNGA